MCNQLAHCALHEPWLRKCCHDDATTWIRVFDTPDDIKVKRILERMNFMILIRQLFGDLKFVFLWKLFKISIIVEFCCNLNWGDLYRGICGTWAIECAGWFVWKWIPALVDSSTLVACKSRLGKKSLLRAHHFGPLVFERIIFTFFASYKS